MNRSTLLNKILKNADNPQVAEELVGKIKEEKTEGAKKVSALITEKFQNIVNTKDYVININPDIDIEKGIKYYTGLKNNN